MKNIDLSRAHVTKDYLKKVVKNMQYNKVIYDYYQQLYDQYSINALVKKMENLSTCNSFWLLDKYEQSKIKDFKKTNLCKDKFCNNCKKVKQAARMTQYIPELEKYKDNLFHMTLTQPNCSGSKLAAAIKHMAKCFKKLVNYLTGHNKIKGLDLTTWGYQGAVRSLEVTFKDDDYHPHYHVGLVMDKPLCRKTLQNVFSFDFRNGLPELKRLFSQEEILIQKIWWLLINDQKVTLQAIEELDKGYSCIITQFAPSDYAELFKYMTKETDEQGQVLTYDNFETLYFALYRVKQIQGYGCLYRIKDEGDTEAFSEVYEAYINGLKEIENPVASLEAPQDLLKDNQYKLISRKSVYKYLRELYHNETPNE